MANKILVSTNELRNKAETLQQQNQQLSKALEALSTQEQTLSGQWEGDAQQAFRSSFQKDMQKFQEFVKGINEYVLALENICKTYDTAESTNVDIARN